RRRRSFPTRRSSDLPGFGLGAVGDEVVERTMNVVGIAAGANLHGFKAKGGDLVEHGVESEMLVNGIEDADGNLALVARGPRPGRGGGPGFGCTGRKGVPRNRSRQQAAGGGEELPAIDRGTDGGRIL